MNDRKSPLFTGLALITTVGISVADVMLPPQIETIFFYTVPILLCTRSGHVRLPYLITAIAVAWTLVVTIAEVTAVAQPTSAVLYEALNDVFGVLSVIGLAWFVVRRMERERERDLLDVIRFVDTRLLSGDNDRVARMIALMAGGPEAPERRPPAAGGDQRAGTICQPDGHEGR